MAFHRYLAYVYGTVNNSVWVRMLAPANRRMLEREAHGGHRSTWSVHFNHWLITELTDANTTITHRLQFGAIWLTVLTHRPTPCINLYPTTKRALATIHKCGVPMDYLNIWNTPISHTFFYYIIVSDVDEHQLVVEVESLASSWKKLRCVEMKA